jgi:outer membrane protein assembly factor BamB
MDGNVYVIDAGTGAYQAHFELDGAISSTPVAVGDYVYAATETGKVYSLDINGMHQQEVRDLELRIIAPLFAADGIIYIHTYEDEAIYALNTETGTIIWDTPLDSE